MEDKLSERDLLIELRSDFKSFKEYVTAELKEIKESANGSTKRYIDLSNRVTIVEQKEIENTRLRLWIYGAIVTAIGSSIFTVINLVK